MKKLKYKKPKTLIEVLCEMEYECPTWLDEDWTEEQRAELEHREEESEDAADIVGRTIGN